MSTSKMALVGLLPVLGFRWVPCRGSGNILRTEGRDEALTKALMNIADHDEQISRDVLPVLETVFNRLSDLFRYAELGIQEEEGVVAWLLRVRRDGEISLASAVDEETWVEFIYRIVAGRRKYERDVPRVKQDGERQNRSGLVFAVDRFRTVTEEEWERDRGALYVYTADEKKWDGPRWEENAVGEQDEDKVMSENILGKRDQLRALVALAGDEEVDEQEEEGDSDEEDEDDSDEEDEDEEDYEPDGDEQIVDLLEWLEENRLAKEAEAAAARAAAPQQTTMDLDSN